MDFPEFPEGMDGGSLAQFISEMMEQMTEDSLHFNVHILLMIWGAKTGRNPRYLLADCLATTPDDKMWEKVYLPEFREMIGLPEPRTARPMPPIGGTPEGGTISEKDAEDLRALFGETGA